MALAGTSRSPSRSNSATGGAPSGGRRTTNRSLREVVCSTTSSSSTVTRTPPTMSLIRLNNVAPNTHEAGQPDHAEQPRDPRVVEDLAALQLVALPSELCEPSFDVVDGAGVRRDIPQQHPGRQQHPVQHDAEHQRHLERAPRIDVPDHPGHLANPGPPADHPQPSPHGRPPWPGSARRLVRSVRAPTCRSRRGSGSSRPCGVAKPARRRPTARPGVSDAVRAPTGRRRSQE